MVEPLTHNGPHAPTPRHIQQPTVALSPALSAPSPENCSDGQISLTILPQRNFKEEPCSHSFHARKRKRRWRAASPSEETL